MGERLDIDTIRATISAEMERKGFKARGLSLKVSNSPTLVRDLLTRTDNPGIGTLFKIAEALDLPFEAISGVERVPLAGRIGAGGVIAWLPDDEQELVPRPPLSPGPLMALQVHGESMLPKYESGDVIYVRRDHDGVLPAYLGDYCAVISWMAVRT